MKKFVLIGFGFAGYTLFSDEHIEKADGTKIVADPKGEVALEVSSEVTIYKKKRKVGEVVKVKMSDIMAWGEDEAWEDVPAENAKTSVSKEVKDEVKTLNANVAKASSDLVDAVMGGATDTKALATAVADAKKKLADYLAAHPEATAKAKTGRTAKAKTEVVYTDEEKANILAYTTAKTAHETAKTALATAIEAKKKAAEALPSGYKIKGGARTGEKPPKMTDEIRAEIVKCTKGEAYTAKGVAYPAKAGGESVAQTARVFGYSGAYTAAQVKKA